MPVKDGERLVGLVSIRDVIEHRIEEIERKSNLVRSLVLGSE